MLKHTLKKRGFLILATIFSISFSSMIVSAQDPSTPIVVESYKEVSPRAPIIKWRIKIVNRIAYKRLFNHATQQWVGNWIKC